MSRSARLLDLTQTLRRHRHPVSGQRLADESGVSLRTVYRDIATLQAQGADIEGEPGLGYVLKPGFMLPPLMFSEDEIEALVLGARWVATQTDAELGRAATNLLAKIAAVLPDDLKPSIDGTNLMVAPAYATQPGNIDLAVIRKAIRNEHMVDITYLDAAGATTSRRIWPFVLGFFERVRVVAAWCTLREDVRHFRADRIVTLQQTGIRYPKRKAVLLKDWRAAHDADAYADKI
jgi:predicted DNA-binding transcriptional regulator YafY